MSKRKRLPTHTFDLPVQELRRGYRSDVYFWRSKIALEDRGLSPAVTMQYFQKHDAVLCGVDEAIAVLEVASGRYTDRRRAYRLFDRLMELKKRARATYLTDRDRHAETFEEQNAVRAELDDLWESAFDHLVIDALHDGDRIEPWETVLHVSGDYSSFGHLETITLGVLARRTRVASNVRRVVDAAGDKPVLFFPARFDHWAVQGGDGYAAHIGGVAGVSTEAQTEWWGDQAVGTVPHALIAALAGDTVEAVRIFGASYPDANLVALVDFHNDSVRTSLDCARALGDALWGVRLDTSENLVDRALFDKMGMSRPNGVTPQLVREVRRALDREGFSGVRIIASGGFDAEKIRSFERDRVPVDAYGIGSALLRHGFDFTADVVLLDGRPSAKAGRRFVPIVRRDD